MELLVNSELKQASLDPKLSFILGHNSSVNHEISISYILSTLSCLGEAMLSQEQLLKSSCMWLEETLLSLLGALINIVTEACWEKRGED